MTAPDVVQVIIPAHNEGDWIADCLTSLLQQEGVPHANIIVVANGCSDDTVARARAFADDFARKGWNLHVADLPGLGKIGALNEGDRLAGPGPRVYLDADIRLGSGLLAGIAKALSGTEPRYAGGRLVVSPAQSTISRLYARFWQGLPFVRNGVTGAGLFAVNEAGRKRWGDFPQIISDDTFVRLQFSEDERVLVDLPYEWPIAEGFKNLVRVRRRQDHGVNEINASFPQLIRNEGHVRPRRTQLFGLALRDPMGFAVYLTVALAVRSGRNQQHWARGR